jgi:rod shape-determining protein MreD
VEVLAVRDDLLIISRTSLLLIVGLVLQIGLLDDLRVMGVHPELLLAVAVGTGVARGAERGAMVGFAAGLLTDLFLSGRFGIVGLSYGLAGYSAGLLSDGVPRTSRWIDAGFMAVGSAVGVALYAVIGSLFGMGTLGDPDLWRIVVVVCAANAVLSPLVLRACRWTGAPSTGLRPTR